VGDGLEANGLDDLRDVGLLELVHAEPYLS